MNYKQAKKIADYLQEKFYDLDSYKDSNFVFDIAVAWYCGTAIFSYGFELERIGETLHIEYGEDNFVFVIGVGDNVDLLVEKKILEPKSL